MNRATELAMQTFYGTGVLIMTPGVPEYHISAYAKWCQVAHRPQLLAVWNSEDESYQLLIETTSMLPPLTEAQAKGIEVLLRQKYDVYDLGAELPEPPKDAIVWGVQGITPDDLKELLVEILLIVGVQFEPKAPNEEELLRRIFGESGAGE